MNSDKIPFCINHMAPRAECCDRPADDPDAPHERGGPLPTICGDVHPNLARIVQRARGMIQAGAEPMDVGAYVARRAHELPLTQADLQFAIGYLLNTATDSGRQALLRMQREMRKAAEGAHE